MARVRSIARLITPTSFKALQLEGEAPDTIDVAPVFEVMKAIAESKAIEGEDTLEESSSNVEVSDDEEDDNMIWPSKPSHIEFGQSTMKPKDLDVLKRLGYIGEKQDEMIKFTRDETIIEPKSGEIVVFRSFFLARIQLLMYEMIVEVLKKYEIFIH